MKYAPVVMFVYNRADHFEQTYEALNRCPEAEFTNLYIFSDGAKSDKDHDKVAHVRTALRKAKDTSNFRSVDIIESPVNRGLAASVIAGVTKVINEHGRVIVVEDDSVPSPCFLKFMNMCLQEYQNNERVGAVAGFTPQLSYPSTFENDIFFAYRSCSCAWATWKDRWKDIDWELKYIRDFYNNPSLIRKLNLNGKDRFIRLYRQTKGNGSSWSVRFGAHLIKNNQLTLYPRYSYIENIGCDETGVHSKKEDAFKMNVDLLKAIENPILTPVVVEKQLQVIMKRHYSAGIWSEIKRTLATIIILMKERRKK